MECDNQACKLKFEALEKQINKIDDRTVNYAVMEERIKNIDNKVDSVDTKVDKIDDKINKILEKPNQRWELLVTTVIVAVVSSGITYAMTQILK